MVTRLDLKNIIFERGKFFGIMWHDTNYFENEAKNGPYRP